MLKKLKGALRSKTVWFAAFVAALSVLQGFVFVIPLEPKFQALIGVVLAVVVTVLRFITKDALDDK
jgi:hypothetical protein